MSELVEDVGALIDGSGAQRMHLVGHDFGGLVAWSFAASLHVVFALPPAPTGSADSDVGEPTGSAVLTS